MLNKDSDWCSTLFGGPSQPEPYDNRGGIQTARRRAATDDAVVNPNQYENDAVCFCLRSV